MAMLIAAGLVAGVSARAQTASQIAPPPVRRDVPPPQPGELAAPVEAPPSTAIPGGDLRVQVRDVVVAGGLAGMKAPTEAIIAGLKNRTVTVAEVYKAALAIEAAYARSGYILVRVVVPAQDLHDGGDLNLTVVDGFIERIDTSALPANLAAPIAQTLTPWRGKRVSRSVISNGASCWPERRLAPPCERPWRVAANRAAAC